MQCINTSSCKVRNILLTISYDGSAYHGYQIQQNALTIQEVFQTALEKIIGKDYQIKGCSRTDSGVHANMYCLSLKTSHKIPTVRLKGALNRFLPLDIVVIKSEDVSDDFHARYSCTSKQYIYKILNSEHRNPFLNGYVYHYRYNLDVEMLNRVAQQYVGTYDYTSFCTIDNREKGDLTRTVKSFSVYKEDDIVIMSVEADGFLYNMVRIMVGTLLRVAQGKFKEDDIIKIIKAKDRFKAGPTAPASGLYLNKVNYDK